LKSVAALVGCIAGAVLVDRTKEMIQKAGLKIGNITEKSINIDLMIDCQDPLYAQVKECLPEGTKIGDYVVSVDITAIKD
jgi:hypothetical protein